MRSIHHQQSGVVIAYDCSVKSGDFLISLEKNEIENTVCGKISTPSEKIPLCENARNTGYQKGCAFAYFENLNTSSYPCVTKKDHGISGLVLIYSGKPATCYTVISMLSASLLIVVSTKQELASNPVVDFLETLLFNAILTGCQERNVPLVQEILLAGRKKYCRFFNPRRRRNQKRPTSGSAIPGKYGCPKKFFRIERSVFGRFMQKIMGKRTV